MKDDEQVYPFALVPVEVVMDKRLTLEAMRVLVTLYSFRNKNTGLTCPSRDAISERCGMHPSNISDATTKLVELGWLKKNGSGGHSKATRYDIHIPEIVAEQATLNKAKIEERKRLRVADSATVAQSTTVAYTATSTLADSATSTLAESAIRNKATDKITDKGTENTEPSINLTTKDLLSGISRQISADFLSIRKAKKAPLTQTALNAISREAGTAGISLEDALTICCERGWASFKASWLLKDSNSGKSKQEAIEERNRAVAAQWVPPELREKNHAT